MLQDINIFYTFATEENKTHNKTSYLLHIQQLNSNVNELLNCIDKKKKTNERKDIRRSSVADDAELFLFKNKKQATSRGSEDCYSLIDLCLIYVLQINSVLLIDPETTWFPFLVLKHVKIAENHVQIESGLYIKNNLKRILFDLLFVVGGPICG